MIWTICLTMGVCFIILLYLQLRYARTMMSIRREQFNENVLRSLDIASRNMERNETMLYLREVVGLYGDSLDVYSSSYGVDISMTGMHTFQRRIRNAYIYEKEVLDEVILRVLYASGEKGFEQRVDKDFLVQTLRRCLRNNGIDLVFHYRVFNSEGR